VLEEMSAMGNDGGPSHAAPRDRFVIQRHDASSLHFDVRLEIGGVLVSWAVPKGPSTDPAQRRLARRVDDHALDHIDVEGRLGTGTVIVWDTGTYAMRDDDRTAAEALAAGHLTVVLHGRKLAGGYALIRTGDRDWLMVKTRDDAVDLHRDPTSTENASVLTGRTNDDYA
jgi:DNA ligase D-like protein (predicted 3'-phosphoesterase)